MDKSQHNFVNDEVKSDCNDSNYVKWIVAPMGHDNNTARIYPNVMYGAITGIDGSGNHKHQLMVGALVQHF